MKENFIENYTKIKRWFWYLPIWQRTILTSLIGSTGGAYFLGFVNKYALYYHAFKQGFRIPVEGVEYLDFTVGLMSFIIILSSTLGIVLVHNFLLFFVYHFNGFFDNLNHSLIKLVRNLLKVGFVSSLLLIFLGVYFISLQEDFFVVFGKAIIYPCIIMLFLTASILFSKNVEHQRFFSLGVVVIVVIISTLFLFNQNFYTTFLNRIKFGGRVKLEVEYRKADNTGEVTKGELLIRTNSSIIIERKLTGDFEEIPTIRISKLVFEK